MYLQLAAIDQHPLTVKQKRRWRENYYSSVSYIDSINSGLVSALLSTGYITIHQKDYIESATTNIQRNERIWEIARQGSQESFFHLIVCLEETGHAHVAKLFRSSNDNRKMLAHRTESGYSCFDDDDDDV